MKQPDVNTTVEKEAYAFLIKNFIVAKAEKHPRFVLIGFDSISDQLENTLKNSNIQFVMPERSGRLKEASLLRGKNDDCLILVSRHSLGKFASLVTAFKILDEVINPRAFAYINKSDLFDLSSVAEFLISQQLEVIGSLIQERIDGPSVPLNYTRVRIVLSEILQLAERRHSFYGWLHPRRILSALITIHCENAENKEPSIAIFLRALGIESTQSLENVSIFKNDALTEDEIKALKANLLGFARILRFFLSSDVTTQRRNIARLCNNQLRFYLYDLCEQELKIGKQKKWMKVFFDYERMVETDQSKTKSKSKTSKYRTEPRGVSIHERSPISGLPKRMLVPLNISLKGPSSRNLLKEFSYGLLDEMILEYSKIKKPNILINVVSLSEDRKKLMLDFKIKEENGYIRLDIFLDGLKNPSLKIHRILEEAY